MRKRSCKHAAL